MYKNQLQELAQRSCFNLPSYTCIREGPDHAPRFKAAVNFNGESFESLTYCSTLRQAEHSAAEVALNALACRGPSNSLAARILDETGVYKNLLQEVSQRVGASLPAYTTFRTGLGHLPVFTCTVELAGVIFTGEPAKNKKQAEKNAAMEAWLSLKSLVQRSETPCQKAHKDEQEHVTVARALQKYLIKARLAGSSFPIKFPTINPRPTSTQQSPATTSKILPLIYPKAASRNRPPSAANNIPIFQKTMKTTPNQPISTFPNETFQSLLDSLKIQPQKFPAVGAAPYIPIHHCNPLPRTAPPVTIRNTVPVFSAPPVCVRQAVPAFAASVRMDELPAVHRPIKVEDPRISRSMTARTESPSFKHSLGHFEEPLDSKTLPVFVAAPNSENPVLKVNPTSSETPTKVESPVSKVSSPPTSSGASAEETRVAEIEGMKDLKI